MIIKKAIIGVMTVAVLSIGAVGFTTPSASALSSDKSCAESEKALFGIVPWYRGLLHGSDCSVSMPDSSVDANAVTPFIITIALNILQAGLSIAAYVTVFFLIKGGFMYMTSTGSSDGMSNAKKTITNAIIGLLISLFSAAIVNAITGII